MEELRMIKLSEGGIAEMWKDEKSPEMQAISYALQKAVAMVIEKAEKTKCFSDIDKLDEKTLDYFAVEQRAMYYSQTLPIEQKKAIIKNTLNWYTKAGTPAAVSEMVDVVLGGGKVVEWFDFDCYKEIRSGIKDGVPFWPMGWADNEDKHLAAGIRVPGDVIYLGVWRRGGETDFEVPLDRAFPGKELEVSCIYPKACGDVFHYDDYSKKLKVHFPETYMARLFQIKVK